MGAQMANKLIRAEDIGARIREKRLAREWTQDRLARVAGLSSAAAVSNYENGVKAPASDTAARIARALRVSLTWLLTGDSR